MTKIVALLTRMPGMERQEFHEYWRATHGPLLVKIPSMRGYIQSHVIADQAQTEAPFDGVAEMWFDSAEAFQAALASPEGRAGMADLPNFCDMARVQIFSVEEVPFV